jgi:hypothetical protein
VTAGIAKERSLPKEEARTWLYENCVVRVIAEPGATMRALLEAYTALALQTKYNDFTEKGASKGQKKAPAEAPADSESEG